MFFLGTPAIALTVAVLLAMYLLGIRRGMTVGELARITGESLKPIGMILLVVGAGAFFGAVLRATGVGKALAGSMSAIGLPVIVSAYLISAALRLAQGSATVAIVTTAGIIAAAWSPRGATPRRSSRSSSSPSRRARSSPATSTTAASGSSRSTSTCR